ncbi:MAG: type II toxin-antitoxin system RatA family toxin [Comamonadaceae bacterium]|nr:MAG: type II toxin-antitoxin system RatA family toxin [Comamonadaceae bacterium]
MKSVLKSVLIWYSAEQMYALVTDVAKYPEFLPWCDRARVIEEDASGMTAEVGLAFGGVRQSFTTRNTHVPGREVHMKLVKGPFSQLDGVWKFTPVGEEGAEASACRVELSLQYGFDNFALQALVGPVFDKVAASLVEAFVKRSEQVYGAA